MTTAINLKSVEHPFVELYPRASTGCACTEAPRGVLYHRYALDTQRHIREAKIIPPASQNQKMIENDLRCDVVQHLGPPEELLTWRYRQAIHNYAPCISCATHFLKLHIKRA